MSVQLFVDKTASHPERAEQKVEWQFANRRYVRFRCWLIEPFI